MITFTPADEMHRLAKRAMDNGTVASRQEAEALLRCYRIALSIGPDEAIDRHHQAALLTAVELDVAPNFYPALSSFWRLDLPFRACWAAGADAEPLMLRSV